ncbi:MAG: tryptophan 2,3-dioxygenase family protein [Phaeodactylibacter sp.]|uniref:tryptophan 2,3-dioxygenase family protein n=1 Tax=Phaeodactylibacter sp. TaxID=1940289 RepID=UPI0032ECA012
MELTHEILERLEQLEDKYAVMGQDMLSYLDGLLYADYLTYWDYIHLDTLLSLQTPETPLPDEKIFIIYHQITELYFKLSLLAIEQLVETEKPGLDFFKRQVNRVNRYFDSLVSSFEIMVEGMDRDEFLKFRMSLLPASGFQSAQYRKIELMSTDMYRLVHGSKRGEVAVDSPVPDLYERLYWKSGATELATGKKTLTLKQFEQKYAEEFQDLGEEMRHRNLWQTYLRLPEADRADEELRQLLRHYDFNIEVRWPLSHLRSAVRYLDAKPQVIEATGGTNWQDYLPPRKQRIIFFPDLWTHEELEAWGKSIRF